MRVIGWMSGVVVTVALMGAASAQVDKRSTRSKNDPDAVRCVRSPVTGSLAQFKKVCMTNREWDQHHADIQQMTNQICSNQRTCGGS